MALEQYLDDMKTCCRCSCCKFVTLETLKNYNRMDGCPSIARYNYRAYSGGGRLGLGVALAEKQIDYDSKKLKEIIYNCQMCGACDVSCKYAMDMDVQEALYRFPVDVNLWVVLGDAHLRTDDLQDALDAYTKAEDLVR